MKERNGGLYVNTVSVGRTCCIEIFKNPFVCDRLDEVAELLLDTQDCK